MQKSDSLSTRQVLTYRKNKALFRYNTLYILFLSKKPRSRGAHIPKPQSIPCEELPETKSIQYSRKICVHGWLVVDTHQRRWDLSEPHDAWLCRCWRWDYIRPKYCDSAKDGGDGKFIHGFWNGSLGRRIFQCEYPGKYRYFLPCGRDLF